MIHLFKKYKIFAAILMICLVFLFSCRKVKMKDEKEVLVGTWQISTSCNVTTGCSANSTGLTLIIYKNGLVEMKGGSTNLKEQGRFVKMKLIDDPVVPTPVSPGINYFYEIKIKKKNWSSKAENLITYHGLRYSNGYFDTSGNFVAFEQLFLYKASNGTPNYLIYERN